jgi:isopenicillin-N N-acyltransferase-like protein
MILIDSSQGKVRNYEWQPDGNVDIIEPEQDVITHANHFVVHPERDALVGRPKNRDVRLRELLMAHHGHIDLEVIMNCLKDHKYYSLSVCSHPNPEGDTYSKNRMTVSSMICDFTLQKVYITAGPPCCNAYIAFDLSEIS